jgi:electron transfer flavoprotein alpha subunit
MPGGLSIAVGIADFGVVGDLFQVAPQPTQEITNRKG